jgi:hypothetical protein
MCRAVTEDMKPPTLFLHEARARGRSPSYNPHPGFPGTYPIQSGGFPFVYMQPTVPANVPPPKAQLPHPALQTPDAATADYSFPSIRAWLYYLENHPQRGTKPWTIHSQTLGDNGFDCVTQLSLDFLTLSELQEMLNINKGTAVLLFQYAKEDMKAIKDGILAIPEV